MHRLLRRILINSASQHDAGRVAAGDDVVGQDEDNG